MRLYGVAIFLVVFGCQSQPDKATVKPALTFGQELDATLIKIREELLGEEGFSEGAPSENAFILKAKSRTDISKADIYNSLQKQTDDPGRIALLMNCLKARSEELTSEQWRKLDQKHSTKLGVLLITRHFWRSQLLRKFEPASYKVYTSYFVGQFNQTKDARVRRRLANDIWIEKKIRAFFVANYSKDVVETVRAAAN